MSTTKLYIAFLLLLAAHASRGQALSLTQLLALSDSAGTQRTPEVLQLLPVATWKHHGFWENTNETYWTYLTPDEADDPDAEPAAWISLRPNKAFSDVVYKTTLPSSVAALRGELRKHKLTPEPVSCIECEGMRYSTPEFRISIYSKKKGDYPFVVVVRRLLPDPNKVRREAKTEEPLVKAMP